MLTTFDLDEYAYAALKAGASGFLLKDVPPAELLSAIRAVHAGDAVSPRPPPAGCWTVSPRCPAGAARPPPAWPA